MAVQRLVLRDRQDGHVPAFRRVERNDVVALLHRGHAGADVDDNAGALVTEDGGKKSLGVGAGQGELVGVADAGRLDLDEHLARARAVELHLRHFERFAGCEGHGGTNVHVDPQDCSGGSAKGAKVCMRRMQKQECATGLTKMYDAGR